MRMMLFVLLALMLRFSYHSSNLAEVIFHFIAFLTNKVTIVTYSVFRTRDAIGKNDVCSDAKFILHPALNSREQPNNTRFKYPACLKGNRQSKWAASDRSERLTPRWELTCSPRMKYGPSIVDCSVAQVRSRGPRKMMLMLMTMMVVAVLL